ncbi:Hypothetical protein, putative [Bodo saltans]|uniref:Uncharacterized protein n=1 Tax=Bodo saltans TaxID=75058 RepID=A0A0S4IUC9_BODSA|nr:Hypothetical protein, putative [Bodo saltans]|eukprot:CUF27662.1 Hypothetical protein, putative [Bodo saltans]
MLDPCWVRSLRPVFAFVDIFMHITNQDMAFVQQNKKRVDNDIRCVPFLIRRLPQGFY